MKGSTAPGNRRRAAPRSPPCHSGSSSPRLRIMSVAVALLAMLMELGLGYPERLRRIVGHPVIWIGRFLDMLEGELNRETSTPRARRIGGIAMLAIMLCIVGAVTFFIQHALLRLPFGVVLTSILASTL